MSPSKLSRMTLFLPSQLLADAGTRCVLHHPCSNSVQGTHHTFKDIPVAVSEKVEIWPLKHGQYFRENDEQKIHIDLFFKWMTYDEI